MPFVRCQRRGQVQRADDDQNHRPGVSEIQPAAVHFIQQEEYTRGDDRGRPDKSANAAALAAAFDPVTHPFLRSAPSTHAVPQHEKPDSDQQQREEQLLHAKEIKQPEIVHQEQRAQPN